MGLDGMVVIGSLRAPSVLIGFSKSNQDKLNIEGVVWSPVLVHGISLLAGNVVTLDALKEREVQNTFSCVDLLHSVFGLLEHLLHFLLQKVNISFGKAGGEVLIKITKHGLP